MPHGYNDWEWFWMTPEQKQNAITAEQNATIGAQQAGANTSAEERQKAAFKAQQEAAKRAQGLFTQMQDPAYQAQQRQNATQVAGEQAERAGAGAGRVANTAARTAGLNPGQAAATGSRAASDVYSGAYNQAYVQQQAQAQNQMNQMLQNLQLQMGINPGQQGSYGTQGMQDSNTMWDSLLGAGAGVTGAFASSDEKVKDNIQETDLLDPVSKNVRQISYTYKGSDHPENGISAQDLEKTPLKSTVVDTPQGKMVDTKRLTTANTGMIADLARKVDKILQFYKESA
jgi:hypothetical protein